MTAAPERSGAFRLIAEQRRHQPDVVRLARSLCLAAQAEPYFLRGARLRFAADSGTGLEARLWFSPLVEAADSRALVLYPEVSAELRRELSADDLSLLGSVRDFTLSAHRCAPPLVRGFEELLWAATIGPQPAEAEVERTLAPLFRQVLAEGRGAAEASRWILRFLPRLPDGVRESLPAWRLQVMAAERLGMEPPRGLVSRTDADEVRTVRAMVHTEVDIGVRAEADGLVLTRPPERDALVLGAGGAGRVRLRLRAALPGAQWHELDLYDGERAAPGVSVAAEARADGTLLAAQAELGGTVLAARAGRRAAAATTADGRTVLRIDDGESVLTLDLPAEPRLLAVTDAGPAATAVVTDKGLHVVTTAVDGTADAVSHPLPVRPTAMGWSRLGQRGVLCLASANTVLLVDEDAPGRTLGTLSQPAPVVRLWCSVRAGLVAVADADGGVTVHRLTPDGPERPGGRLPDTTVTAPGGDPLAPGDPERAGGRLPDTRVTALSGDPWSGTVVWATADGQVYGTGARTAEAAAADGAPAAPRTVTALGRLPSPACSLALLPDAGLVVAADGGDRLLRLPWPGGGRATAVPMPFRIREVHPAPDGMLLLSGHGGEVEIRAENGRGHLFSPGPVPAPPGWPHDSVGVELPPGVASLPAGIRRRGIGHLCLPASLAPGSDEFTALLARARDQGLRVLADLAPADGSAAAHGELLRRAYDLLEEPLDGLRLRRAPTHWPEPLLARLRHLLAAYPRTAVVTTDGQLPGLPGAHHLALTLTAPPAGIPASGEYGAWALPDRLPAPRAAALLALPGCHEVPHALLTPSADADLRPLLAARAAQLALRYGTVERLPAGDERVTAVRREHAGQSVLCLTSSAGTPLTARVPWSAAASTELIEIARDDPGHPPDAAPQVLRPSAANPVAVRLEAGRTRWFRTRSDPRARPTGTTT